MRPLKHVPAAVQAAFRALQFQKRETLALSRLSELEWRQVLDYCDRMHLTLALARDRAEFPSWVRSRMERAISNNAERFERIKAAYLQAADRLKQAGIEFVVLKGFTHVPRFIPDVRLRVQYDIDLFSPKESVVRARDELVQLGYEPLHGFDQFPIDHLPALIRKTGWEWTGDFFDPEIPPRFELHYQFWDSRTECLELKNLDKFWERRVVRELEDIRFTALDSVDALGYAALHAFRHLLRGDLRTGHIYELASFLHGTSGDERFWQSWRALHDESLRALEAIMFALARDWFSCSLNTAVEHEIAAIPAGAKRWIAERGAAPIEAAFHSNKDELWLHLSLLKSRRDQAAVIRRRLFPLRMPGQVDAVHVPDERMTLRRRALQQARYLRYVASRFLHHAGVLIPTLWNGVRWWWRSRIESTSV
jgi:hypothetical protein